MITYFNPRTREGCDINFYVHQCYWIPISIHAPVKGATEITKKEHKSYEVFQSTHP